MPKSRFELASMATGFLLKKTTGGNSLALTVDELFELQRDLPGLIAEGKQQMLNTLREEHKGLAERIRQLEAP